MLIDSHCHLNLINLEEYENSIDVVLENAYSKGVKHFLCVAICPKSITEVKKIASNYINIYCAVGIHPLQVLNYMPTLDWLLKEIDNKSVIAIGETGLDYCSDIKRIPIDKIKQQQSLKIHLEAAKMTKKPIIIHTRHSSILDCIKLLKAASLPQGGLIHCFTDTWDIAKKILDIGFYISISGIVTFSNANELRNVARLIPDDRLLIETDTPYLAPVPYRGKQNRPQYLIEIAKFIALLRGVSVDVLAENTTLNFNRLFFNK